MARKAKGEEMNDETNMEELETAAEQAAPATEEAESPIEPTTVQVENAVTEDQMREKVRRMAKGRKNYELCGTLKASPSTIANFIKGNGKATAKMLQGLGVREEITYVITDVDAFNNLQA